ncbi:MAG: putative DNA-binding domain-containing protein [Bacteroidota bacterium]
MSFKQQIDCFSSALVSSSQETNALFIEKIKKTSKISPQLAIDIYKNNTWSAKLNALKAIYPACKNILGDDIFTSLANEFVSADIRGQSNLNNYGTGFDLYLSKILSKGRLSIEYSYLSDLASLEFSVHTAYYADNDSIFDFDLFEHRIQIKLPVYLQASHSLALLSFHAPIYDIWLHNVKNHSLNSSYSNNMDIQPLIDTQYLIVYREKYKPVVLLINYCEYQIIKACLSNKSLQSIICDYDCDIEKILPILIDKKWITDIK